jgi:hypothetical protein
MKHRPELVAEACSSYKRGMMEKSFGERLLKEQALILNWGRHINS